MYSLSNTRVLTLATALVIALALILVQGTGPAFADPCPTDKYNTALPSNRVGATATVNSNDVTYTFQAFVTAGSGGIPGLIEYCVYPDAEPDDVTTVPIGWTDSSGSNNFSFLRPNGDPTNIPYDGASHTMGTATWSSGVPSHYDRIVLHINDPAECDRLYDGNPGTCFVLPGTPEVAQPLTVSKDATGTDRDTFTWTITKSVDKTIVEQVGGTATFNYTVSVSHDGGLLSMVKVAGTITVTNPNSANVTIASIADQLSDGTVCSVDTTSGLSVGPGNTAFSYVCLLGALPQSPLTNTVTVTWSAQTVGSSSSLAAGSATFPAGPIIFATDERDECVTVTDTNPLGPQGVPVCVGVDPNPKTFNYSVTVNVPQFDCVSYTNTASFVTNDSGTTGAASQTVKVCGPAKTGALTMGFWQNKNGQGIITGQATTGICPSTSWLRLYAPFQDLSAAATCAQVGTYVTTIIKAADCGGSTCNAMLKAQMLATALDAYFSDPALGGKKINAPAPIGGVSIDLTKVCTDISVCSTFTDTSSAFGGATSLTISQMLSYAASQSNAGGTSWYGQVKATQVLAKDAFDAINNQVAFAP